MKIIKLPKQVCLPMPEQTGAIKCDGINGPLVKIILVPETATKGFIESLQACVDGVIVKPSDIKSL